MIFAEAIRADIDAVFAAEGCPLLPQPQMFIVAETYSLPRLLC